MVEADGKKAIELMRQGRHDTILELWDSEFRPHFWEGFGGHYLQMVGALGGQSCRDVVDNLHRDDRFSIWSPQSHLIDADLMVSPCGDEGYFAQVLPSHSFLRCERVRRCTPQHPWIGED